ncbi:UNVERIFIED_CONTAM: hypothetical protein FKN15_010838 [Acipenser sinensis]
MSDARLRAQSSGTGLLAQWERAVLRTAQSSEHSDRATGSVGEGSPKNGSELRAHFDNVSCASAAVSFVILKTVAAVNPVGTGRGEGGEGRGGEGPPASLYLHMSADGSEAPPVYRRRGGVVEHRDVIKAHEAHKIQSTPQALRKEWE